VGIVRLVNDGGKVLQITASDNVANVFRGYMTNAVDGAERLTRAGCEVLTSEIELVLAERMLESAKNGKMSQLHQAWAIGLVSDEQVRALLAGIDKRYAEELAHYPVHVYSFVKKRVREQFSPEDDIWTES
jgi:hypothetical protein